VRAIGVVAVAVAVLASLASLGLRRRAGRDLEQRRPLPRLVLEGLAAIAVLVLVVLTVVVAAR
jgi:hypothetical protein